ncbi:unnamed protein product [Prorocentrum cordatum]|uniref:Uncharacterized protein n=1 Tax=Prorocentrum cordatum TaxID=2364126 RepID=A0ABN9Y5G1_9DINO|nr:unnamed protein product [Polarella glacialis]
MNPSNACTVHCCFARQANTQFNASSPLSDGVYICSSRKTNHTTSTFQSSCRQISRHSSNRTELCYGITQAIGNTWCNMRDNGMRCFSVLPSVASTTAER